MSKAEVINDKYMLLSQKVESHMKTAAIMIGGTLEGHAKEACPVDTGLLRNSITYALGGEQTHITSYASDSGEKAGKYEGSAEKDEDHVLTVYVGTNVEYAPYIELGHKQEPGRYVPAIKKRLKASFVQARPFLRPAVENNRDEISQILLQTFRDI